MLKIAVAGTGYVGMSIATLLSQHNSVTAVDVVPEISVHDDTAFISQLTAELQQLVPDQQVVIVVDHNYTE